MSDTIPSDAHAIGDTGHVSDHNNISDMLSLLSQVLAGTNGVFDGTNATAIATLQAMQANPMPLAAFYPNNGDTGRATVGDTADPFLQVLGLQANGIYMVQGTIAYHGGNTGGGTGGNLSWSFTEPAGTTFRYTVTYVNASGNTVVENHFGGDTSMVALTTGETNNFGISFTGTAYVSTTSGNFTFNWGLASTSTTQTHVTYGSSLLLHRIG